MGTRIHFLDDILPPIDLADIAERAFYAPSSRALFAGGALLTVGFLWRTIGELYNLLRSRPTDFLAPFVHLIGFCALFAAYRPITSGIVHYISQLGVDLGGGTLVHETFARRLAAFEQYSARSQTEAGFGGMLTRAGVANMVMTGATYAMYIAVQALAFIIKTTQLFTLATIIAFGPILLGFASVAPFFYCLGIGWFWALVEVSAWSFTMDVLLFVFDQMGRDIPQDFIFVQEMVVCAVVLFGLSSIAYITSMLVRGSPANALIHEPLRWAATRPLSLRRGKRDERGER